jgi:hypothetical protein
VSSPSITQSRLAYGSQSGSKRAVKSNYKSTSITITYYTIDLIYFVELIKSIS